MNARIRVALIDGLPYKRSEKIKVFTTDPNDSWDSDFFGVPEFRNHGQKMLKIITEENPEADVIICPFYPKHKSVFKNYILLARSIVKAVDQGAHVISISLEVMGTKRISSEMLAAYKHAYKNKVVICVSAGNNNTFYNPLIHKKYTISIVGLNQDNKLPLNLNYNPKNKINSFGIYGGENQMDFFVGERINCSIATARFSANAFYYLSKKEKYTISIKNNK
ncbi:MULTISPECIES: S8 family serine peptidase [Aquimarina]|uniref:S8 family serine peptidase n=1 Tax=Aquimarina TaxID=290174 RepID=UPI0009437901|nr:MULTISPECIES: S8 family serine peptidase [Aquimarina]